MIENLEMKDWEKAFGDLYCALESAHHFIKSQDQDSIYITETHVPAAVKALEKRVADALKDMEWLIAKPD